MMGNDKKRILVIEDDEEMRFLLKDFLEEEGYEIDSVGNGSEVFRKIVKEVYDLIVTDVRMPGLSGLDILPGMKKLQPKVPIIVITAFGSDEVYRKAMERGASAYLEKPIQLDNLRTLIQKILFLKAESEGKENGRDSYRDSWKIS